MPEKRKTETELELSGGDKFPSKRARQQVSYDDLDEQPEASTSTQVASVEAVARFNTQDSLADASGDEYGADNWNKRNSNIGNKEPNKQNARHNYQPRVDPTFGQRSAFPGLDDVDSDELLYGPPEDGLEYLRLVRSEAKSLPSLFTAPKQPQTDTGMLHGGHEDNVLNQNNVDPTSQKEEDKTSLKQPADAGFVYIDGVVIATSIVEEDKEATKEHTRDVQASYYNLLKHRFILLRTTLRCTPPAEAIAALDETHPISLPYNVKAARIEWRQLLFTSEPRMAQLACMDMETVLGVLRVLGSVMIKCVKDNEPAQLRRVGAWAWGLLGRCRDVGELGSEEVGELRVFGRKAANMLKRLNKKRTHSLKQSDAANTDSDRESSDDEAVDLERVTQQHTQNESKRDQSEEQYADDADLEAAKFNLHSKLFPSERDLEETEYVERRRRNTSSPLEESDSEVYEEDTSSKLPVLTSSVTGEEHTRIFLDMIISIVGEFYGQRDLLQQRETWN